MRWRQSPQDRSSRRQDHAWGSWLEGRAAWCLRLCRSPLAQSQCRLPDRCQCHQRVVRLCHHWPLAMSHLLWRYGLTALCQENKPRGSGVGEGCSIAALTTTNLGWGLRWPDRPDWYHDCFGTVYSDCVPQMSMVTTDLRSWSDVGSRLMLSMPFLVTSWAASITEADQPAAATRPTVSAWCNGFRLRRTRWSHYRQGDDDQHPFRLVVAQKDYCTQQQKVDDHRVGDSVFGETENDSSHLQEYT